jgi:hypothetical protein
MRGTAQKNALRFWAPESPLRDHRIHGVVTRPLLVATIQRLPHSTIESTLPSPGTVSPRAAVQTPAGPSKTAVPL